MTRRTAARVRRVERWAHVVIAHEASAQFHRRPFVRLLEVGLPVALPTGIADEGGDRGGGSRRTRILHCPTDPVAKASGMIRDIVESIGSATHPVEYLELVGRPHDDVLEVIARSDIVLDEVYGDTPMGVLAAEAAWLATATICGGYFAGECRPLSDGTAFPPGFVLPDAVQDELRLLVDDAAERLRRSHAAETFVRSRWTPGQVAGRVRTLIVSDVPESWLVDPAAVSYVDGYGMARATRIAAVRAFIQSEGEGALALGHRPDLVAALTAA
jgi:hypothetical protein